MKDIVIFYDIAWSLEHDVNDNVSDAWCMIHDMDDNVTDDDNDEHKYKEWFINNDGWCIIDNGW